MHLLPHTQTAIVAEWLLLQRTLADLLTWKYTVLLWSTKIINSQSELELTHSIQMHAWFDLDNTWIVSTHKQPLSSRGSQSVLNPLPFFLCCLDWCWPRWREMSKERIGHSSKNHSIDENKLHNRICPGNCEILHKQEEKLMSICMVHSCHTQVDIPWAKRAVVMLVHIDKLWLSWGLAHHHWSIETT